MNYEKRTTNHRTKLAVFNLCFLLLLTNIGILAQHSISGSIFNESNEPVAYANLLLLQSIDSTFIGGTITNDLGHYQWENIEKGTYILEISFIGFQNQYIQLELQSDTMLNEIILKEDAVVLEQLIVTGKRRIISKKIDRLVFDVANSSKSSQGDAMDLLAVSPGIRIRNESISMIGKSGVAVMINDKMLNLSGEDLASFLRSIPSEDISKIEVITAPPAKYEAQGNGGIINIQLKKAKADSWNLSLNTDFRKRTRPRSQTGANFILNKNKLNFSVSLNYLKGFYNQEEENEAYFPGLVWDNNSSFERTFDQLSGRLDIAYELNPKWTVGGQYIYSFLDQKTNDAPFTQVRKNDSNEIVRNLNSRGQIELLNNVHSLNFFNQYKIDSSGKSFTINLDYFNFNDLEEKQYEGQSVIKNDFDPINEFYKGVNTSDLTSNNISLSLDFVYPTKIANFEIGGKYSYFTSNNNIDLFNSGLQDEPIMNFQIENNDFKYIEIVQAGYISAQKALNDKLSLKAGLRLEATQSNSKSQNLDFARTYKYKKLFPSFFLAYNIDENTDLSFTYNKRISRAPFYMLTPNPWVNNPFQSVVGNPFIQPSFSDNIEVGLAYKNFNVATYFNKEKNVFTQVPYADSENNIMEFRFDNFLDIQRVGGSVNYLFEHFDWWSSSNSIDVNHSSNTYRNEGKEITKLGYNSNFSTSNDFSLRTKTKNKIGLLNISYWYSPKGVDEMWNVAAMSNLSVSLQFYLLEKRLKLTLRANDVLKTEADRITTSSDGVFQDIKLYYDARFYGFVLRYSLGNSNILQRKNKIGNQDERSRAGQF